MKGQEQQQRRSFPQAQQLILVVDEYPTLRSVLGLIINRVRHQLVGEPCSGEEALWLAYRCEPSLILLDLDMPHLEGLSVLRKLHVQSSMLPVIVATMLDQSVYALRCMRLSACVFLSKWEGVSLLPSAIQLLQHGKSILQQLVSSVCMQ
jgi:two-component system response regulator EvgA